LADIQTSFTIELSLKRATKLCRISDHILNISLLCPAKT